LTITVSIPSGVYIILGSQRAIRGKTNISAITRNPVARKGIEERKTSPKLISGGASCNQGYVCYKAIGDLLEVLGWKRNG
jgi:hypothetical protein